MRIPIIARATGATPPALSTSSDATPEVVDSTIQTIIEALQAAQAHDRGVAHMPMDGVTSLLPSLLPEAPAVGHELPVDMEHKDKSLVSADPATRPSPFDMPGMAPSAVFTVWLIFGFMVLALVGLCIADWNRKSRAERCYDEKEQNFFHSAREVLGQCCGKRKKKAAPPKKPTTSLPTQSNPLFTPLPMSSSNRHGHGSSGAKDPEKGAIVTQTTAAAPGGNGSGTGTIPTATSSSPSSSVTAAATPSTAGNYRPNSLVLPSSAPRLRTPSSDAPPSSTTGARAGEFNSFIPSTAASPTTPTTAAATSASSPGGGSNTGRVSWSQTLVDEGSPVVGSSGSTAGGGGGVGIGIGLSTVGGTGTSASPGATGSPFFMGASTGRRGGGSGDESGSTSKGATSGRQL
ncbi:hypothetical protein B0T25DRAFT_282263 [Lasiosphaeria hispida]|uniref:Uncharacterized protein n=1 Tax=Lasiosphaeria hispida TaxID=260671 RepID=A0AAJ0HBS5_9PEZI|nr:hypothetical protein B0T25DRAFT_282263 [Lasiosphaeria hispida]